MNKRKSKKARNYILFGILFLALFLTYGLWPRDGHGDIRQESTSPPDTYEDRETNHYTAIPPTIQIVEPTPIIEQTPQIEQVSQIEQVPITELTTQIEQTPQIESTPTIEPTPEMELRYGFTEDEIYLLAQVLCGDENTSGDGEYDIDFVDPDNINYYEVSKVLCVVMNRVRDDRFPSTVEDVVLAKNQFSVMPKNLEATPSEIALIVVKDWCKAYDNFDAGAQCVPENHVFFTGNGVSNITRP